MSYHKLFTKKTLNQFHEAKITNFEGKLPKNLNGVLYRNTSVSLERDGKRQSHWFDGDGAILKVKFQNGVVSSSYKFVQTEVFKKEEAEGRFIFSAIGGLAQNYLDRWRYPMENSNRSNTSVLPVKDKLLSLWEGGRPYSLDLDSLDTIGEDYLGQLSKNISYSAHPKVDPDTGEIFNIGSKLGSKTVQIYKSDTTGNIIKKSEIDFSESPYYPILLHDMCLAGDYLIFTTMPIKLNIFNLVLRLKPFPECSRLDDKGYNEIVVLDKKNLTLVKKIKTDPFFFYHYSNGFVDSSKNLVIDLIKHNSGLDMFNIFPKAVVNGTLNEFNYNESKLVRMTISMDKCKVINENVLFDKNCELPTVSDRSVGKNNEFILLNYNNKHMFLKDLAKIDLNQNKVVTREFGKNEYAGEPLHIKDDKTDYIIALVYNAESDKSEVRILDFESLEDVAKFDLPYDVHYSYHGKWKELS